MWTGCQWKAAPGEYEAGHCIHKYFQEWAETGFFERLWATGLEWYDELGGSGREWKSMDGSMVKAPLARKSVRRNPTDRGKMRRKRSVLTDEHGLPLSIVLSNANMHDVKLLEAALEHIVTLRTEPEKEHPQNLCLDTGYTGSEKTVQAHSYTPISARAARKRRNWSAILISVPAVGSLRSLTLFSTVSANCKLQFLACMDNYRVHLIAPARMSDADIMKFQSSLREVMFFIKYSKDHKALSNILATNAERFQNLERRAADVIKAVTNSKINYNEREERVDMCPALQDMRRESETIGMAKGRAEGITEGIAIGESQKAQQMAKNFYAMGIND